MESSGISRRAMLLGAGAVTAWATSPAQALLARMDGAAVSPMIESLLAAMTVVEKAGQLTLNAAAWAGGAANALNPTKGGATFETQLAEVRGGHLTGVFNGHGTDMARRMQTKTAFFNFFIFNFLLLSFYNFTIV